MVDVFWQKVIRVVVRGVTADTQVIEQLAHLFCLSVSPVEIRGIKLHRLISHLSDSSHGALGILFQCVAYGVKLQPDRNGRSNCSALEGPRQHRRHGEKRPAGNRGCGRHETNPTYPAAKGQELEAKKTGRSGGDMSGLVGEVLRGGG